VAEAFIGTSRKLAGYDLVDEAVRIGNTYVITVSGWYARYENTASPRDLLNAIKSEAAAAGASQLKIIGALVENPRLNKLIETMAGKAGLTFERISSTEFVLRGAVQ